MADDKKKGFSGAFGLLVILVIVVLMFTVAGGYRGSNDVAVSSSSVTRAVPASGNLTPMPDYHQGE